MYTGIGKRIRIRRLLDKDTGTFLIVPMDHGYTLGPIKGIDNIKETVTSVYKGGASSIVVHKGIVRSLVNSIPKTGGFMIHVSGSTSFSPKSNYKITTGSVPEVLTLGGDAISCHVNLGADDDFAMLEDLAKLTEEALDFGLPVLAMMYVRNSEGVEKKDATSIAHAARIAEEIGADIVKVNTTPDGEGFDEVTQGVNIPVVIAGGAKTDKFDDFLHSIKNCILSGAAGVSVGRNIFQAENPQEAMKKVKQIVKEATDEVGGIEILS